MVTGHLWNTPAADDLSQEIEAKGLTYTTPTRTRPSAHSDRLA